MIRKYGLLGSLRLFIHLIRTKLLFRRARLIRFPIDIRYRHHIEVGIGFTTGRNCRLEAFPPEGTASNHKKSILIGKRVQINDAVHIVAKQKVYIGDDCLIASKVFITDCSHGTYSGNLAQCSPKSIPVARPLHSEEVHIGDRVWIGEGVVILPGVRIGDGAIIGALSVVKCDIPAETIAVGIPAKAIKRYNRDLGVWERI